MRYQKFLGACAAAALVTFSTTSADAAISLSLTDAIDDPLSVTLLPGQSFSITLQLTASPELVRGLSFNLETLGLGSSQFRITGRDITASLFDDLITSNTIALAPANALLNPVNDSDLGAVVSSDAVGGTQFVATFTIQALPTIPTDLTYTIRTTNGIATDDNFADVPLAAASYTVHVVPEPTSALLAGLGAMALIARRRRS